MKTKYYYQAEVIELDYTDEFCAYLEFESVEEGLRLDITLGEIDGDNEFMVGAITSSDFDIESLHNFAENMLNNVDYCTDIWRDHMEEKNRKINATH